MKERLQKILARTGVASRRAAEALIVTGRVRVNGRIVTELGTTADPRHDRIDLDGKRVVREPLVYVLFHKPRAMVATMKDPEGRPAVGEVVAKIGVRVVPVGRLDFHTSGALLLTNDGELTDALLHPRREVPKVYVAKMRGSLDVKELELLRNGVVLDDGEKTRPAEVFVLREEQGQTWVEITLYEGKNRQIHRMGDAVGHTVLRLARISFAGISTEGLRPGEWRPLDAKELERLTKEWVTPRRQSDDDRARAARTGAPMPERTRAPARGPRGNTSEEAPSRGPRSSESSKSAWDDDQAPSRGPARGARSSDGPGRAPKQAWRDDDASSRGPARSPRTSDGPTRGTKKLWRDDEAPSRGPARGPSDGPSRAPKNAWDRSKSRGPARSSSDGPSRGPKNAWRGDDAPSRGPGRSASDGPSRGPKNAWRGDEAPSRGPARSASDGPSRGPKNAWRGDDAPSRGPSRGARTASGPGRGPGRPPKASRDRDEKPAHGTASRVDRPRRGR